MLSFLPILVEALRIDAHSFNITSLGAEIYLDSRTESQHAQLVKADTAQLIMIVFCCMYIYFHVQLTNSTDFSYFISVVSSTIIFSSIMCSNWNPHGFVLPMKTPRVKLQLMELVTDSIGHL